MFAWPAYNTLVVLAGASLLGMAGGLVGSFAVLRRRSLLGDALAHAALPGLCLAFLLVGRRSLPAMQAGALATGVLGVIVIALLRRATRVKEDAAIGIVLSVAFGAGVVLLRYIQNETTEGSKAGLDAYLFGKTAGMIAADVVFIAAVAALCAAAVLILFKELKLVAFDSAFAHVQGWPTLSLDLLLLGLIAVSVVISLPAVGVVLTAALLILPGAAARFWTSRLDRLLVVAMLFGLLTGAIGTLISAQVAGLPAGPLIVLVGAALFLISALAGPRRGAVARWIALTLQRRQLAKQRLLIALYEASDLAKTQGLLPGAQVITAGALAVSEAMPIAKARRDVRAGQRAGLLDRAGAWTERGASQALAAVRAQRICRQALRDYPELMVSRFDLDYSAAVADLPRELLETIELKLRREGAWPDNPRSGMTAGTSP
ncbi:MAG: metal ABC transporter permease [Pirellulales bacterium]|nr:metal ABC transporter permease [Pirellulales bacterium]